jgi:hypothetical protein
MKRLIFLGANIYFSSNGAAASGLSKYSDKILVNGRWCFKHCFTQEEFDKIKTKLLGIKSHKSVPAVAGEL